MIKIPHKVFGNITIEEPVLIELESSTALQRLKKVDQSGAPRYFIPNFPEYSRYEHSIGVYELLKRYNCSLEEQISGLLHDTSHTAFSHIAELLYKTDKKMKSSYQDDILVWYLQQQNVDSILNKYGLSLHALDHKSNSFYGLEQDLPNLCADRIEYNLHHGIIHNMLNYSDIERILESLQYKDKNWFFMDKDIATKFANISLYFSEKVWGAKWNIYIYILLADVLKYAIKNHIIDEHDLHFSTDTNILAKISSSKNKEVITLLDKCQNFDKNNPGKMSSKTKLAVKFRGVDPLVYAKHTLVRLSELDSNFKNKFITLKKKIISDNKQHLS